MLKKQTIIFNNNTLYYYTKLPIWCKNYLLRFLISSRDLNSEAYRSRNYIYIGICLVGKYIYSAKKWSIFVSP